MNASAPADAKICSKASCASACIFVIRGCMFLLSLSATCQVWTVSLKAGQSTYKGHGADAQKRAAHARRSAAEAALYAQLEKRGIIRLSVWRSQGPESCEQTLGGLCWGLTVLPLIRT